MPSPHHQELHVNRPLTNISVAYAQSASNFIADRVFPQVSVSKKSDIFFKYPKSYWLRVEAQKRAPSTESAGGGYEVETDSYFCERVAIHKDIDDEVVANADDPLNPERETTQWVTGQLLLKRDLDWTNSYFTTGVWGRDRTSIASGSPTGTQFVGWSDYTSGGTSSDPIMDVTTEVIRIAETTGQRPNTLVIGAYAANILVNHPDVLDRIKYTQGPAIASESLLAQLFNVDRVVVCWSSYTTTAEKAHTANEPVPPATGGPTVSFMQGKHALLAYVAPAPGLMTPSAGYTFTWTGLMGSGAYGNRIRRLEMPMINSVRIEGEMCYAHKVVAPDVGTFFQNVVG